MVEGWAKFERVCLEVGAGELPRLLHCMKSTMTPTLTPTPTTPVELEMKQWEEEMDVGIETEVIDKPVIEKPIHISLEGGEEM